MKDHRLHLAEINGFTGSEDIVYPNIFDDDGNHLAIRL
jgi:hypothetical protein